MIESRRLCCGHCRHQCVALVLPLSLSPVESDESDLNGGRRRRTDDKKRNISSSYRVTKINCILICHRCSRNLCFVVETGGWKNQQNRQSQPQPHCKQTIFRFFVFCPHREWDGMPGICAIRLWKYSSYASYDRSTSLLGKSKSTGNQPPTSHLVHAARTMAMASFGLKTHPSNSCYPFLGDRIHFSFPILNDNDYAMPQPMAATILIRSDRESLSMC